MTAPDPRLNEIQAIPAEAVEAAAKMIVRTIDSRSWDSLLPSSHEWYRDKARAALEAAHPRLLAELRKAHEALERVEKVLYDEQQIWAAICSNTCGKDIHGVDHVAISDEIAATIRAAVAAAKGGEQ